MVYFLWSWIMAIEDGFKIFLLVSKVVLLDIIFNGLDLGKIKFVGK